METGPGAGRRPRAPVGRRHSAPRDADAAPLLALLRESPSPPPAGLARRIFARVRSALLLRQILDFGVAGFVFGFLRGLWPQAKRTSPRPEATRDPCDDRDATLYQ